MRVKMNPTLKKSLNLTNEQVQELKEAFEIFDQDKSGYIEKKELRHALQVLGQNPTNEEVEKIIQEADVIVMDGKIDFNEFARVMKENYQFKSTEQLQEELESAFQIFDRDRNGYISRQEMEFVLTSIGEKLTQEEVDEMFRYADANEDGKISYTEFVTIFNSNAFSGSFESSTK